jgi:hypothetical protein
MDRFMEKLAEHEGEVTDWEEFGREFREPYQAR